MKKIYIVLSLIIIFFIGSICSSGRINLGKGYSYFYEQSAILAKENDIPPTVLDFKYNRKFIIAKQKPKLPSSIMYAKVEYPYGDSVYYWIIIKKEHRLIGPLNKEEFKKNKEKYNIKLKLSE